MPGRPPPQDPGAEPRRRGTGQPSFGEEGRYSSDQARYYGADTRSFGAIPAHRPHAEPPAWRRGRYQGAHDVAPDLPYDEEDARNRGYYSLDGPHGGQEYGIEPHGYRESIVRRRGRGGRPAAGQDRGPYGDQPIDPWDPGVRQFGPPADYAYHPSQETEFELEYLDWREERLRSHDRDYAAWRAEQQRRYDSEYLAFRGERQDRFGRSFADWIRHCEAQDPLSAPASESLRPPEDRV